MSLKAVEEKVGCQEPKHTAGILSRKAELLWGHYGLVWSGLSLGKETVGK